MLLGPFFIQGILFIVLTQFAGEDGLEGDITVRKRPVSPFLQRFFIHVVSKDGEESCLAVLVCLFCKFGDERGIIVQRIHGNREKCDLIVGVYPV